jgi:pantoate--beta-alanine ligase
MHVFHTKQELSNWVISRKNAGKTIGFVPTMGALHSGHQSLMKLAGAQCDEVIVSVFVNPTQFGPNEDFSRYPRTLEADCKLAEKTGVSVVFAPSAEEMYGHNRSKITIAIDSLNNHLCGKSRPGHFEGVLLIVNKLFNIVQPHKAFFGKKDIQQCMIIRAMIKALDIPVELVLAETVRETDGLALSSRNRYLSALDREKAPLIFKTLKTAEKSILKRTNCTKVLLDATNLLKENGFKIDYIELVNESDLQPVSEIITGKSYILACAVFLGTTRLIDNVLFTV